jgi:hypothetical protein
MNTLQSGLPPLPENAVYLGKGREFTRGDTWFNGYAYNLDHPEGRWEAGNWEGNCQSIHYAAPKGSEIARLNGHEPSSSAEPNFAYRLKNYETLSL